MVHMCAPVGPKATYMIGLPLSPRWVSLAPAHTAGANNIDQDSKAKTYKSRFGDQGVRDAPQSHGGLRCSYAGFGGPQETLERAYKVSQQAHEMAPHLQEAPRS